MAESSGSPGGDYSRSTFDQIIKAVTGYDIKLHSTLDAGLGAGGWFKTAEPEGASNTMSYRAWDHEYFRVEINNSAYQNWNAAANGVEELAPALANGKLGLMDAPRLWDARNVTEKYVRWLENSLETTKTWVAGLDSEDSAFRGKAAYAIQVNLKRLAFTFNDLRDQIMEDRKPATPVALDDAAEALRHFGQSMAWVWWESNKFLFNQAGATATQIIGNVMDHLRYAGLFVSNKDLPVNDNRYYVLDDYGSREEAEEYIRSVMARYDSSVPYEHPLPPGFQHVRGDLSNPALWQSLNAALSGYLRKEVEKLDLKAREEMVKLAEVYTRSGRSMTALKTNQPPNLGSPPPDFGNGNGNGPPGSDIPELGDGDGKGEQEFKFEWPPMPPDGKGSGNGDLDLDLDPGDGNGNGNGNGDLDLGNGSGGLDLGNGTGNGGLDLGNGTGDFDLGDGLGNGLGDGLGNGAGVDGPGGLGGSGGSGGFDGFGNGGPGVDGFGNGAGDGGLGGPVPLVPALRQGGRPTGEPERKQPSLGDGKFDVPELDLPDQPGRPGQGGAGDGWAPEPTPGEIRPSLPSLAADGQMSFGAGSLQAPGMPTMPGDESGGGAGSGLGSAFAGTPGFGGSAGDGLGGPGTDRDGFLAGAPDGRDGFLGGQFAGQANPGGAGSRDEGRGGMPFFPPMMGGMGGLNNNQQQQERERQTWLSEDEEIWGTDSGVGLGVIGRPDAGDTAADELVVPTHVHVRSAAPRGRTAPAERTADHTAQSSTTT
ncbi:hypothetical protein Q5530_36865 [Saccharothrix sp. BKS2]|uniref:hypothetical protein n=1 Tax=Saccharothrix sp. BKS2 TaxID=3064400 RepID=UPI0039ECFF79